MPQVTEIQHFPGRKWKNENWAIIRPELKTLTEENIGTNDLIAFLGNPVNEGWSTGYGHIGGAHCAKNRFFV